MLDLTQVSYEQSFNYMFALDGLIILSSHRMSPFTAAWSAWVTHSMLPMLKRRSQFIISQNNSIKHTCVQVRQLLQSMDACDLVSGCQSRGGKVSTAASEVLQMLKSGDNIDLD